MRAETLGHFADKLDFGANPENAKGLHMALKPKPAFCGLP
jgi:hypothetical protein